MLGDTSLLRMVIKDLSQRHRWSYQEAFDRFYNSRACRLLSNRDTGVFTYAPIEIIELFEEEL
jgi:hypothetical protein